MLHKKTCQVLLVAFLLAAVMGSGLAEAKTIHATPILSPQFTISALASEEYYPAIAYNSNHDEYLVVWDNKWSGGDRDIYAQRISATGELISGFVVASGTYNQKHPSAAYDPIYDRYLVVWAYDINNDDSDWDIHGRLIPWNGPLANLEDFSIYSKSSSHQVLPQVVYAQATQEFMVVWVNNPGVSATTIGGRRITASNGTFPTPDGVTIASGADYFDFPDIAYNLHNNEYLVVWHVFTGDVGDIYGVRLSGDGVALGSGEFGIAGWPAREIYPAVAACDQANQYMVAWQSDQDTNGGDYAIYARYLDGNATPGNVYLIDDTDNLETQVDISCDDAGEQYMLDWQRRNNNLKYGIWAKVAHTTELFDPSFEIVSPGASESREYSAVGGGRGSILFAWMHETSTDTGYDIHGRLYSYYGLYLPVTIRE